MPPGTWCCSTVSADSIAEPYDLTPRPARDQVYMLIASNRYRWSCKRGVGDWLASACEIQDPFRRLTTLSIGKALGVAALMLFRPDIGLVLDTDSRLARVETRIPALARR